MVVQRKTKPGQWEFVSRHRRWGCLVAGVIGVFVALVILILLLLAVHPRAPLRPYNLIGADTDGLMLFNLHAGSMRVDRFLETVVRPLSLEVQSNPEDLEDDLDHLLDVVTYRSAMGLTRFDTETGRELWAVVVPLKRMGGPLKMLIYETMSDSGTEPVERVTSGGVVLFSWGESPPYFAVDRRALIASNDEGWREEMLRRVHNPFEITPRANHLSRNLIQGTKHSIMRSSFLVTPGRWDRWTAEKDVGTSVASVFVHLAQTLQAAGLRPPDVELVRIAATLQAPGDVRVDIGVKCNPTTNTAACLEDLGDRWSGVAVWMRGPILTAVSRPTTSATEISFSCKTPTVEQLIGLGPEPAARRPE
jgi:hypothetical protein